MKTRISVALCRYAMVLLTALHASSCSQFAYSEEPGINSANVLFLPGDAFFHSHLTESLATDDPATNGRLRLSYRMPDNSGGFGLFFGYNTLEIAGFSETAWQELGEAYRYFRSSDPKLLLETVTESGDRELMEVNPFSIFVYSVDCDFSVQRFGLKYNESWPELNYKYAVTRDATPRPYGLAPYVTFVPSTSAIVEDWRNAKDFPPLEVRGANDRKSALVGGPPSDTVLSVRYQDVILIVLPVEDLGNCFSRVPGTQWIEISSVHGAVVKRISGSGKIERDVDMLD